MVAKELTNSLKDEVLSQAPDVAGKSSTTRSLAFCIELPTPCLSKTHSLTVGLNELNKGETSIFIWKQTPFSLNQERIDESCCCFYRTKENILP